MQNSKHVAVGGLTFLLMVACGVSAASGRGDQNDPTTKKIRIVTVVKRTGIGWFERMEAGIKEFAAQNGVDATMTGADDADPQKQADIIQKLIGEEPDAITVVPNSREALEEVLAQARAAGIEVVTHEARQVCRLRRPHHGSQPHAMGNGGFRASAAAVPQDRSHFRAG